MKKQKPNSLKLFGRWKTFLTEFEENGVLGSSFPEDVVRSDAGDRMVFYTPQSKVVYGVIFKDVPLSVVLLIHPQNPAVELFQFADTKGRRFLGWDTTVTYPRDLPPIDPEDLDARTREVLAMAFPEDIVERLLIEGEKTS